MTIPNTPLFVKTHDFIIWLIKHTQRFPKSLRQSYTFRLENVAFDFQESILMGNSARVPARSRWRDVQLDQLDHHVKETMQVPGYVRYADDMILFCDSKEELWQYRTLIAEFLQILRLTIHPHKTFVQPCDRPVTFLGMKVDRL